MRTAVALAAATVLALAPAARGDSTPQAFDAVVTQILAEPYQPDYVPLGTDRAFAPAVVPNTAPAQDYTSGSIQGSPDAPAWPAWFQPVTVTSGDGAPLLGFAALHFGTHPGVVVAHGFNTHGRDSVIRWAATLYANGYDVAAVDQRDFNAEFQAGYGPPSWRQTFGWKESEDVLAVGRWLRAQPGVSSVGVVGFSEGAQNTVLALALDGAAPAGHRVFDAGLEFSGPSDQATQIGIDPVATNALVTLVVPPYDYVDACSVLKDAAALYATTPQAILAHESAYHAVTRVAVPLLGFYAADDELVPSWEASMMAAYEAGNATQRTYVVQKGNHAYFYDRWWQQRALLLYFKALLPGAAKDATVTTAATVDQTAGGAAFGSQLVDLGSPTRADADALATTYACG
jgi:hypothetical protein